MSLSHLRTLTADRRHTDPRDGIFALLGLTGGGKCSIKVDYGLDSDKLNKMCEMSNNNPFWTHEGILSLILQRGKARKQEMERRAGKIDRLDSVSSTAIGHKILCLC